MGPRLQPEELIHGVLICARKFVLIEIVGSHPAQLPNPSRLWLTQQVHLVDPQLDHVELVFMEHFQQECSDPVVYDQLLAQLSCEANAVGIGSHCVTVPAASVSGLLFVGNAVVDAGSGKDIMCEMKETYNSA